VAFSEGGTRDNSQREPRHCRLCIQQSVYKDSLEAEGRKKKCGSYLSRMALFQCLNDMIEG